MSEEIKFNFKNTDIVEKIFGYKCLSVKELDKQQCIKYLNCVNEYGAKEIKDIIFFNGNTEKPSAVYYILSNQTNMITYSMEKYQEFIENCVYDIALVRSRIIELSQNTVNVSEKTEESKKDSVG